MLFYTTENRYKKKIGILHFGIGLIGTAIKKYLLEKGVFTKTTVTSHHCSWEDSDIAKVQIDLFFQENLARIDELEKLYIIWSAGKAGFGATKEEVEFQFENFRVIVDLVIEQLEILKLPFFFYLMSSGGGLYEGQTLINSNSVPNPQRPYGDLKLQEENYILSHPVPFEKSVFRLSSVYSTDILDKRKGLMLVLMQNGLKNKVSQIFGRENTLRDYVLDKDIARYLINKMYNNEKAAAVNFLASGKPSTIFEIRKYIEKTLNKRIFIAFSSVETNSANMSYAHTLIPTDFIPTDYKTNIKQLYNNLNS